VCVAANLVWGGTMEVALPALAHTEFGADGFGAMLACLGLGALLGSLHAARAGKFARPAIAGCVAFLIMAAASCLVPYLPGLSGATAAVLVVGAANGYGNVVLLTLLQKWAPGHLMGRVMGLFMIAAVGCFPLSVLGAGLFVRQFGTAPYFPLAAGLVFLSVLGAQGHKEIRMLGARGTPPSSAETTHTSTMFNPIGAEA
jgi:hypothetical protein